MRENSETESVKNSTVNDKKLFSANNYYYCQRTIYNSEFWHKSTFTIIIFAKLDSLGYCSAPNLCAGNGKFSHSKWKYIAHTFYMENDRCGECEKEKEIKSVAFYFSFHFKLYISPSISAYSVEIYIYLKIIGFYNSPTFFRHSNPEHITHGITIYLKYYYISSLVYGNISLSHLHHFLLKK